jgi:hypothetical protein
MHRVTRSPTTQPWRKAARELGAPQASPFVHQLYIFALFNDLFTKKNPPSKLLEIHDPRPSAAGQPFQYSIGGEFTVDLHQQCISDAPQ